LHGFRIDSGVSISIPYIDASFDPLLKFRKGIQRNQFENVNLGFNQNTLWVFMPERVLESLPISEVSFST